MAQPGSALRSGRRGPQFESAYPDERVGDGNPEPSSTYPVAVPYGWPYAALVLLQAAVIPLVRDPGLLPRIPRHPLLGLLPLVTIGGGVIALGTIPGAVGAVTDLAALAVPPLALLAVLHVRRWALPLALVSPLLWLLAWRLPESGWTELAGDLLIVLAGVSLGRLTGWIAPRAALVVGVLVAMVVDIWQVLTVQVGPVAQALSAAAPPRGLPALQQLELLGASMGWGDVYLAAIVGAIVAASVRATVSAALATATAGLLLGLLFGTLDLLPATVPPTVGLIAAGVVERQHVAVWMRTATSRLKARRMPADKET